MIWLNVLAVVCIGLLAGVELAVSVFVNPVLWKLDPAAGAGTVRAFARNLGAVMPVWYSVSMVLLLVELFAGWHGSGSALLIVSSAIWAAVILLTLLFLVPINSRLAKLDTGSWTEQVWREHRTWDTRHRVRIAALVASWVCLLLAIHV
ncbi:MAG TPA: anthrone oxygenase family protein [Terracidiphilus sp.]|nr:anthrone oxygenase family protein [Terracidiphilus sp.]